MSQNKFKIGLVLSGGGVLDNLPVKPIENNCSYIIGSFVNPTGYEETVTNLISIAERAFLLSMSKKSDIAGAPQRFFSLNLFHKRIQPPDLFFP